MGGITDSFPEYAFQLLDTLRLAMRLGKRTAMFSQGLGPLNDPELRRQAQQVLSRVDLIALRETRASGPLLKSFGVPPERIIATGDDAIEKAYARRVDHLGDGLGLNVRSAAYSGVDAPVLEQLRPIILQAAMACGARIVGVPTSRHPVDDDAGTLRVLLSDCAAELNDTEDVNTPERVIENIQRCRILITGSYHAGVFALAQGTPIVCLANSTYYSDKFFGLLQQFAGGGELVSLNESGWSTKFGNAVANVWESAERVRPQLLESARKQIQMGRIAYQRLHDMMCLKA
jgi:polysaccharide pyruvyl transferase WcaK-like protein